MTNYALCNFWFSGKKSLTPQASNSVELSDAN